MPFPPPPTDTIGKQRLNIYISIDFFSTANRLRLGQCRLSGQGGYVSLLQSIPPASIA